MRRMNYCPVCASPLQTGSVCTCGYDISRDYESWLSLQKMNSHCGSVHGAREAYGRKKKQELQSMIENMIEARVSGLEESNRKLSDSVEALKKELQEVKQQSEQLPNTDKVVPQGKFYGLRKKTLKTQDVVTFGSYPQGAKGEVKPIEWIVLDERDNKRLLLSRMGLDCKKYHSNTYQGVTWQNCALRQWLNNDFLGKAFNVSEQQTIENSVVRAYKNKEYGTNPGNDTYDKVFLLSPVEVEKYIDQIERRKAFPTEYAKKQGCYVYSNGCCAWWLRSPGFDSESATKVDYMGESKPKGIYVSYEYNAVRPAIWLKTDT